MELTKAQRNFFADLDLDSAIKAGEGKVHFEFPHKGHVVAVGVYGSCEADITVKHKPREGQVDLDLTLLNIPGTENMSGPAVLRMVHAEANKSEYALLKEAWQDTPDVDLWPVDVMGSRVKFSWHDDLICYELWASKSQETPDTTTVELLADWEQVHTFLLPMRCPQKPTAQSVYVLANTINKAWRAVMREEYDDEVLK